MTAALQIARSVGTPPMPGGNIGNPFGGDWFSQAQQKRK